LSGLIDTHCHLDFEAFEDDRAQVLERAYSAGVKRIVNPGIDFISSQNAIRLAEINESIYVAVGYHPNSPGIEEFSMKGLRTLASHPHVVALGEIGLDYYRDHNDRDVQKDALARQLDLATEMNLPVIIHNRKAEIDMADILIDWHEKLLKQSSPLVNRPGVLHSFSSNIDFARSMVERNFFIGITGPITFKNASDLRETVAKIGLEHLLVETDAPFLAPQPQRGKRNEPSYVVYVAEKLAELFDRTYNEVSSITSRNAGILFNWREED
jgi:TatD DNase family protein